MERRHRPHPPARPLVLLVASHPDTLALYAIALSGMGFEVMAASGAAEAFGRASTNHPDIIVTEIAPQGANGWELLAHLKAEPRTRNIPIVAVTADAHTATRERARREGCTMLLVKPYVPDRLALTLRELLWSSFAPAPVPGTY